MVKKDEQLPETQVKTTVKTKLSLALVVLLVIGVGSIFSLGLAMFAEFGDPEMFDEFFDQGMEDEMYNEESEDYNGEETGFYSEEEFNEEQADNQDQTPDMSLEDSDVVGFSMPQPKNYCDTPGDLGTTRMGKESDQSVRGDPKDDKDCWRGIMVEIERCNYPAFSDLSMNPGPTWISDGDVWKEISFVGYMEECESPDGTTGKCSRRGCDIKPIFLIPDNSEGSGTEVPDPGETAEEVCDMVGQTFEMFETEILGFSVGLSNACSYLASRIQDVGYDRERGYYMSVTIVGGEF